MTGWQWQWLKSVFAATVAGSSWSSKILPPQSQPLASRHLMDKLSCPPDHWTLGTVERAYIGGSSVGSIPVHDKAGAVAATSLSPSSHPLSKPADSRGSYYS